MKVLLTGATGYVGRHLLETWKNNKWQIHAVSRNAQSVRHLIDNEVQLYNVDISNKQDLMDLLEKITPEIIVHTAAMSKPNDCETQQDACYLNNVSVTKYLAGFSKKNNSHLLFLLTDFVFNNEGFYQENNDYCPVNYYGKSKQLAEEAIFKSGCSNSVIRVVLVYGNVLEGQRPTFVQWVKSNLSANKTMEIYTDQLRTPCYINDLCWAINQLIFTKKQGVYHICGDEVFTPFSLAIKVADYFKMEHSFILPTNSIQKPELAKRPANATLCIAKAIKELGFKPTKIGEALKEIFS